MQVTGPWPPPSGNFGSEHRLEYTILGSPVNLAARLQTAAEADTILLSESTYLLLEDVANCKRMDDMQLKGFARPVGCYRLNALRGVESEKGPMTRVDAILHQQGVSPN